MQCVELFCGCGAFSAGALEWGLCTVLAVDCDSVAADIFQHNFPAEDTAFWEMYLGTPESDAELDRAIKNRIDTSEPWHIHANPPRNLINWTLDTIRNLRPTSWSLVVRNSRHARQLLGSKALRWVCNQEEFMYTGTADIPYASRFIGACMSRHFHCNSRKLPETLLNERQFPEWFQVPKIELVSDWQVSKTIIGGIYPDIGRLIAIQIARHFFPDDAESSWSGTDECDGDDDDDGDYDGD